MIQELQEIFTEVKFTKVSTDLQDWEQMLLILFQLRIKKIGLMQKMN